MQLDNGLINLPQDTENYNLVKDLVIQKLLNDKIIDTQTAEKYILKYTIIIYKNSWFRRIKDKLNGKEGIYTCDLVELEIT